MLTCQQMTELVTDYLEDRMPLGRRWSFRIHLMMCSRCRTYIAQMRKTIATLGCLPADGINPQEQAVLVAHFRKWTPS